MSNSLDRSFDELRGYLKHGRPLGPSGNDPVFYLVFPPRQMAEVKRKTREWVARLENEGWEVGVLSMAKTVHEILQAHPSRAIWLESEKQGQSMDFSEVNKSLRNALVKDGGLRKKLEDQLQKLSARKQGLLLATDLEVLHPYLRVGALEQELQSHFAVPTVFLYPGRRTGRNSLSFLGIYPSDPNYRSVHIGEIEA